jgi:predicted transcriptional regulator
LINLLRARNHETKGKRESKLQRLVVSRRMLWLVVSETKQGAGVMARKLGMAKADSSMPRSGFGMWASTIARLQERVEAAEKQNTALQARNTELVERCRALVAERDRLELERPRANEITIDCGCAECRERLAADVPELKRKA